MPVCAKGPPRPSDVARLDTHYTLQQRMRSRAKPAASRAALASNERAPGRVPLQTAARAVVEAASAYSAATVEVPVALVDTPSLLQPELLLASEAEQRAAARSGEVRLKCGWHVWHPRRGPGVVSEIDMHNVRGRPYQVEFASGELHQYSRQSAHAKLFPSWSGACGVAKERMVACSSVRILLFPTEACHIIAALVNAAHPPHFLAAWFEQARLLSKSRSVRAHEGMSALTNAPGAADSGRHAESIADGHAGQTGGARTARDLRPVRPANLAESNWTENPAWRPGSARGSGNRRCAQPWRLEYVKSALPATLRLLIESNERWLDALEPPMPKTGPRAGSATRDRPVSGRPLAASAVGPSVLRAPNDVDKDERCIATHGGGGAETDGPELHGAGTKRIAICGSFGSAGSVRLPCPCRNCCR